MSKKQYIKRHRLIIDKLKRGAASFIDIQQYLHQQSQLDEENYSLSKRTFQRDIQELAAIYDIEVTCGCSGKGLYEITHYPEQGHNDRLMETLTITDVLKITNIISQHIILEKHRPLGTENMYGFLHAIKNNRVVAFSYTKYWEDENEIMQRTIHPLTLKESHSRWYIVALDTKDSRIKTFGLDRITNLEITNSTFTPPVSYNAEDTFTHSFGIINDGNPQKIILSFTPGQGRYVKSLPLHHSQQELISNDIEYRISLYLCPTYDFVMELLSLGKEVKVLEPESLKQEIKNKLQEALSFYL